MKLSVNQAQRYAKMRAHTATHLLHAELTKFFPDTKQAGSLVDSDLLRFDFYTKRLLTQEEISTIEKNINQIIYSAYPVQIEEMNIEEAGKLGAKMFFEDKYGDIVRVVQIKDNNTPSGEMLSVELCGGTHVSNTKDIGAFSIISQEAVASGIKRLTAYTGPKVNEKITTLTAILENLTTSLEVKSFSQLGEKVQKLIKDFSETKSQMEALEAKFIHNFLLSAPKKSNTDLDLIINAPTEMNFKALGNEAKSLFAGKNILIGTVAGNFMLLTQPGNSAKTLAQKLGLKGGGNDLQVQGRDQKVIELL